MRVNEAITIYLAVGAPFGVCRLFEAAPGSGRMRRLISALTTMVLWPVVALRMLIEAGRSLLSRNASANTAVGREAKIERAQRNLLNVLGDLRDTHKGTEDARKAVENATYLARAGVERFVGLTEALRENGVDCEPAARELELFRIAGHTKGDQLLAGKCIHRRNVARLVEHQAKARTDLLHSLADVSEIVGRSNGAMDEIGANNGSAERLNQLAHDLYARAFDLFCLIEDSEAAIAAARLMDQAGAPRRDDSRRKDYAPTYSGAEEESCTTSTHHHQSHVRLPLPRTLMQG